MTPDTGQGEHPERDIQRAFVLTSPLMHGPDVREAQDSTNKALDDLGLRGHLNEDGEFGQRSLDVMGKAAYALGAEAQGDVSPKRITKDEQAVIRNPSSRNEQQRERSKNRVEELKARESRHDAGADAAVKGARHDLGEVEHPLGSNRGPFVDKVTEFCGLTPPVFWCGCATAWWVVHEGKAKVLPGNLTYHARIAALARAGQGGLHAVPFGDARAGDIVTYTFEHIGLVVGPSQNGRLHTIEGNTSQTGHVSNGGGVYEHTDRTAGVVLQICRPDYS